MQELHSGLADGAEAEGVTAAVAGRVIAKRVLGKIAFLSIRDDRGQIQVCWMLNLCCEAAREANKGGPYLHLCTAGLQLLALASVMDWILIARYDDVCAEYER